MNDRLKIEYHPVRGKFAQRPATPGGYSGTPARSGEDKASRAMLDGRLLMFGDEKNVALQDLTLLFLGPHLERLAKSR